MLGSLSLNYVYEGCIGAGECEFDGKKCIYEAFYDNYSGNVICHLFDTSGNWVGYEEYEGTELIQTNYVETISSTLPSYVFFQLPSDYSYYYGENFVTWPSDWD